MQSMELPQYTTEFNRDVAHEALIDGSFRDNASALINGYFKFLPALQDHMANLEQATPDMLVEFNENLAQILYGPRVLSLFQKGNTEEITRLADVTTQRLLAPKNELLKTLDFDKLGMILVRPEARFLTDEVKEVLSGQGYEIVLESTLCVTIPQYWAMYNEGFLQSDIYDFPTRTLTYTNGESKILIVKKDMPNLQGHLNANLKGKSGIASVTETLRGTAIFNGYESIKKTDAKLFYDTVDPLGMYRAIARNALPSKDPFYERHDPVLYYAGQGVHLPEDYELKTVFGVLLTNKQLKGLQDVE